MYDTKYEMSDVTVDATGLFCPEPVFRTKIAIEKMQAGQTIEVSADDPAAEDDITRWANRNGHQMVEMKKDGETLTFVIKKVK
ncbi:MAG: sulfurtransferase TusA family protein [Cenarchaeum sp. SB0665_bin_23]|nr:sulfurtransferase TusA family protein [Cenarchaeum sp. SB0667_bin_13]MXY37834.1 sulfurtransferase TusA family protein [Cenarchaeum sp. SB0664_bin_35]MXY61446.1 sulfurtransferase TusA family protein [Cenarchaeum sp. SB0665_bin_23]MYC79270.1 sulfurtransferase TusA family protein [Cenarchaeum sp. SB0661_bin_35]MYG33003.1 sulfurtransferase TusA family protein [Cenarchaeum sp. SB0677_bin_16]MYI52295.1 sulfurtransferase TusA family protein [Cenarchaeum sp. SB0673_bin_9]